MKAIFLSGWHPSPTPLGQRGGGELKILNRMRGRVRARLKGLSKTRTTRGHWGLYDFFSQSYDYL